MKHYDDFLDRMPREEAAEIEQTVGTAQAEAPVALARQPHRQWEFKGQSCRPREPQVGWALQWQPSGLRVREHALWVLGT